MEQGKKEQRALRFIGTGYEIQNDIFYVTVSHAFSDFFDAFRSKLRFLVNEILAFFSTLYLTCGYDRWMSKLIWMITI